MPPDPQLRWLRLWTDIIADPKVRLLAFEDRWHFVAILCMKRCGHLECAPPLLERTVAVTLGLIERDASEVKRRLMEVGLIDENWQPLAWEKRQFSSDLSTHRVREFRKRFMKQEKRGEKRSGNGPEQSRAETEQSKRVRKRASRVPEDFSPDRDLALRELPDLDVDREVQKFRDHEFRTPRSDWAAVWRNWIGTCRESGRYARVAPAQRDIGELVRENTGWR